MEQHFPKFLKKGTTLQRYTQIFENFFPEVFFLHSTVLPEFLEFSVEWFAFGNSTAFEFLETFLGNFCTICHCFQVFESFGRVESAQNFNQSMSAYHYFVWKTRKFRGEFKLNGSSRLKFSGKKVITFGVLPFSCSYRND